MSTPARHPRTLTRQLTIAGIVHGHDGQIAVQSLDGPGTTFRIELPLHRTAEVTA